MPNCPNPKCSSTDFTGSEVNLAGNKGKAMIVYCYSCKHIIGVSEVKVIAKK